MVWFIGYSVGVVVTFLSYMYSLTQDSKSDGESEELIITKMTSLGGFIFLASFLWPFGLPFLWYVCIVTYFERREVHPYKAMMRWIVKKFI